MAYNVEKIRPYNTAESKREQVSHMFDAIAPNYDKLNGVLSMGIDKYWRREAMKVLYRFRPKHVLDIATGTGDFAILAAKIARPDQVIGIDISEGMMQIGRQKVEKQGFNDVISFEKQDCANLRFLDNTFDAAIAAFGVRNFEDIDTSFREILRVLRPGGVFLFLELSTPEKTPIKQLYEVYSNYVMPLMADRLATEKRAYEYLPKSIAAFPQGKEMMQILKKNRFTKIRLRRLTLGICTMYIAEKPIEKGLKY